MTDGIFDDDFGVGYSLENEEQVTKEKAAEISGPELGPRIRIRDGLNRFWVLPSFSKQNGMTVRQLEMHYGPRHKCGRGDWVINEKGEPKKDGNFKGCPRCIAAWNLFDENLPKPEGGKREEKTPHADFWGGVRRKGMSNSQGLIQVVDLTPFFNLSADKSYMTVNKKAMKLFPKFIEVMAGKATTQDFAQAAGDSLSEKQVEEICYSATCGVQLVPLDTQTTMTYVSAYRRQFQKNGDKGLAEPAQIPHLQLLEINRGKDTTKKYKDAKGTERSPNVHTITFEEWDQDPKLFKELLKAIRPRIVNIHDLKALPEDIEGLEGKELLKARAQALEDLTDEEILQYLKDENHSFVPKESADTEEGLEDDEEDKAPRQSKQAAAFDPDAFVADDSLSDEELASVEDLRAEVEAELEDE